MRSSTFLLTTMTVLLLSGCATIPAEQCASTDWRQLGIEDGRSGYAASRLEKHRDACTPASIVPDATAWETGRKIGLIDYCRLPNAVDQGLRRSGYAQVCEDPRFARLYDSARQVGDARYEIESIDRDLDWRERQLLTNRKLSDKRRNELVSEIRALERKRDRVRDDSRDAEYRLDMVRRELGV